MPLQISPEGKVWTQPESVHKDKQWSSEQETLDFLECFVRLVKPTTILEIGSYEGNSSIAMAKGLHRNHMANCSLITYDVKDWGQKELADKALVPEARKMVTHVVDPTYTISGTYDLIFIDDGHEQHEALRDLEIAHKCLNKNGYILIPDVGNMPTVLSAWLIFLKKYEGMYDSIILDSWAGVGVLTRK
jgi:predicted O-methyltransferase YrrM